jgi:hypothetical protein
MGDYEGRLGRRFTAQYGSATSTDGTQTVLQKHVVRIRNAGVGWVVAGRSATVPGGTIGLNGEPPNSAVVTDNNVLVIRVRGDRERFSFHARSLN